MSSDLILPAGHGSGLELARREMLIATGAASMIAATGGLAHAAPSGQPLGRKQNFDTGWRFFRGDGSGFGAPGFDDSAWREVDLPHDWSIENVPPASVDGGEIVGPFAQKAVGGTAVGFAVGGEGWYRKTFRVSVPKAGRAEILFDGVYLDSEVWINGTKLGSHPSGYTPFAYDLTPHLVAGDNVIAVRVTNHGRNSRWYTGSGIYRHVWLDIWPEAARIERWGVSVTTAAVTDTAADLRVETRLVDAGEGLTLNSWIRDAKGRIVWKSSVAAGQQDEQSARIAAPMLWSPETPNLYTLETELKRGSSLLDRVETPFGIRIVTFDPAKGMAINGNPTKLRGGCIHHDNGVLGAASFDAAEERKVALLKARGYNAVRPSHNLFSKAFFEACDRQGMFVVGETFDVWDEQKKPQDYHTVFNERWRQDLATIVNSTRNHPSIVMWSVGNEIPGRNTPKGMELQWHLVNAVHKLDPTRPVTAALNGFTGHLVTPGQATARKGGMDTQPMSSVFLDLVGYNYKLADYEADHAKQPNRLFFGTESFAKDVIDIWDITDRSPWLIGDFVWTAIDYLGEAGIGGSVIVSKQVANSPAPPAGWPWVNADCGDIDLIGQQKPPSFARDVVWGVSPLEMAVLGPLPEDKVEVIKSWGWSAEAQSWSWPGADGKVLPVRVYTAGDRVELFLNGKSVGSKPVMAKRAEFSVGYAPGKLEAVAYRGDKEVARRSLVTVGAPAAVRLTAENRKGGYGHGDVSFILAEIVDAKGQRVPGANVKLAAELTGPARLAAFGSADPKANPGYLSSTCTTWDGRALIVLRGTGKRGAAGVSVSAQGLQPGRATLSLG